MPTLVLALVLTLALPASAQTVRINAPLPPAHLGTIQGYRTGTTGTHVVYLGDQNQPGRLELWGAPLDGGSPAVVLNPPLGGQSVARSYEIDSDASHAAFLAFGGIWIAPTDGSAPAMALTPPIPMEDSGNFSFPFSPDGNWIVYKPTLDVSWPLSSVPSDGSSPSIELWTNRPVGTFVVSLDSQRVVFESSSSSGTVLYSVPIDGSGPPVLLDGLEHVDSSSFRLSPDGVHVVYLGILGGVLELYSVPVDGSAAPVRISGPMTPGGNVWSSFPFLAFTPDGTRVVYLADQNVDERFELYSTPIDGSAASVRLSGTFAPGRNVRAYQVTPDGRRVLFTVDRDADELVELFVVPIEGGVAPAQVNAPLVTGGDVVHFLVSEDSRYALYRADQAVDGTFELYAAPLGNLRHAGTPRVLRVHPPLAPGSSVSSFDLTGDGRVRYSAALADGRSGTFLASSRGGGPSVPTRAASLAPGGYGLFVDVVSEPGGFALLSTRLEEDAVPVQLSAPPPLGGPFGSVNSYRLTSDGTQAVYLADQEHDEVFELYRAPADGSSPAEKLNSELVLGGDVGGYVEPLSAEVFALSPDGARVAYLADQETNDRVELYSVPTDASAAPVKISGDFGPLTGVQPGLRFSPDGARVVYRAFRGSAGILELFSAHADGSAAPDVLNLTMPSDADVEPDFEISPDGSRVVYRADEGVLDKLELYSAPIDDSGPRVRLNLGIAITRDVTSFQLDPQARYVVFRVDQAGDELFELYRAPLAGASPAVRLSAPLVAGRSVSDYRIAPDGDHVVYLADQDVDETYELFSVPITGGTPVKLNGPLVSGGDVGRFGRFGAISPDGSRVAYIADQDADERFELYSAPIDGSAPAHKVSGTLVAGGDVRIRGDFGEELLAITADGEHAVYLADALAPGVVELYAARLVGGAGPVRLSDGLPGRVVDGFRLDAGLRVLFPAHPSGDLTEHELFHTTFDGGPVQVLTGSQFHLGPYSFTPDARHALILGDLGQPGVRELFATRLPRMPRRAGPP